MLVQIGLSYPKSNIPAYDIFDHRTNIIVRRRARRNGYPRGVIENIVYRNVIGKTRKWICNARAGTSSVMANRAGNATVFRLNKSIEFEGEHYEYTIK